MKNYTIGNYRIRPLVKTTNIRKYCFTNIDTNETHILLAEEIIKILDDEKIIIPFEFIYLHYLLGKVI
jgi:hypothetical protein